jgi:hypothetical protein
LNEFSKTWLFMFLLVLFSWILGKALIDQLLNNPINCSTMGSIFNLDPCLKVTAFLSAHFLYQIDKLFLIIYCFFCLSYNKLLKYILSLLLMNFGQINYFQRISIFVQFVVFVICQLLTIWQWRSRRELFEYLHQIVREQLRNRLDALSLFL